MELIIYGIIFTLTSIGSFWLVGSLYGLIRNPKIYFPISLATKMSIAAVFGTLLFMVGGIVLSTLIFNSEMQKRIDYKRWPTIFIGTAISTSCLIFIYFSFQFLVWDALKRGV